MLLSPPFFLPTAGLVCGDFFERCDAFGRVG